jgi:hypothetical protein
MGRKILAIFYQVFPITPEEQQLLRSAAERVVLAISKEQLHDDECFATATSCVTDMRAQNLFNRVEVEPWSDDEKHQVFAIIMKEYGEVDAIRNSLRALK